MLRRLRGAHRAGRSEGHRQHSGERSRRAGSDQSRHATRPCDDHLEGKAEALRKVNPSLTREQAFARAYTDRANAEIAKIERAASQRAIRGTGGLLIHRRQHGEALAVAKRDNALDALKVKAAELRKAEPELSESQAFAKVYEDPANRALAAGSVGESGGPVRRLSNSMPLGCASDHRAVVLRFRRDCLAGGGIVLPLPAFFLLGF